MRTLKVAHEPKHEKKAQLQLPLLVSSVVDIGRLRRELEIIDNAMLQSKLRDEGQESKLPKTSHLMEQTVQLNKLNLLEESHRKLLDQFLEVVRVKAPTIHMSFSADPPPSFIEKIMAWLRREIHPQVLLTVGMQPNIGAGTIVRTANKQFDFSLRKDFESKRGILAKSLGMPAKEPVTDAPVEVHDEVAVAENVEPVISMPQVEAGAPESTPAVAPELAAVAAEVAAAPLAETAPEAAPAPEASPEVQVNVNHEDEAEA